ncbi:hypothetical protein CVS40_12679 [Lucilia cuprina]|nr:hypothetical protein CVS40_12679 [Lucilia cuprina]
MAVNGHVLSFQDYVSALVGAAQATIMKEEQDNLMTLVPQIIRDSLRSENYTNQHFLPPRPQPQHQYNSPLQMEKWGIKYDGNNQVLSVEDFVFCVESLREDCQCS